jgi:hypothetical protein
MLLAEPVLINKTKGILRHRHAERNYFGAHCTRSYLGNMAKYGSASLSTRA